ncbi:MAG: TonB-dependent receptor [Rhizobiaceae bacterium]|nr:TonB-dependent receptor [Rhizobiaceae bacterium]
MKIRRFHTLLLASVSLVTGASAQDAPDGATIVLEEVTVTAQRREQKAKDVPVSLRVLSREDLEGRIAKRLEDAFAATPNASMTSQRGGNDASDISIRGVSTTAFGADPSVSVYVDDVYVGNDNGFNARMSDLEQVEILRGPQGTLYGRNAVGGAVNVRTASPELGVNSATIQTGVGTDGLVFGSATANVALGQNAAARVSLFGDRSDGWVSNAQGGPDFMNLDDFGGRAKLLYKPAEDWEVEFSADYARDKGRKGAYGPFGTVWEDGVDIAVPFNDETENYGVALKSTWQMDFGELVSVTAWRGAEGAGAGGAYTPVAFQQAAYSRDYDQFTQEVRANAEGERFDWTLGGFVLSSRQNRYEDTGFFPALPEDFLFPGQPALAANYREGTTTDTDTLSVAAFGDLTWHATDRLDVIAGARLSYDRKSIDYEHGSVLGPVAFFAPAISTSQSVDGVDISPRVGVTYALTDDAKLYGTISRGYKPAGFNISFAPSEDIGYDAESAINYEVGIKGEALDGRLGYALSAFYFDWRDQQVYSFVNNQLFIGNAPKSRSYGAEAEISYEVTDGFRLYGGIGLLDARFTDYPNAMSGTDESGNWQPFASKFSANLSAEYKRPISEGIDLVARADYNWRSAFYWDTANQIREPGYGIVNARIGIETERWAFSVFAQNLFDQEYRIRAAVYSGGVKAIPGTPQTFGVLARVSF